MATYLDVAGPDAAPAVTVHPDSEFPSTWTVASTWESADQRGAWLASEQGRLAQVVYDEAAPVLKRQHLSGSLVGAAAKLCCKMSWDYSARTGAVSIARLAYYAEREIDIYARDLAAWRRYLADGKPGPDDPYRYNPDPAPEPTPANDKLLQFLVSHDGGMDAVIRTWAVTVHPDSEWPRDWRLLTVDGHEWAVNELIGTDWVSFVPVTVSDKGKQYSGRGLDSALRRKHNGMYSRRYDLEHPPAGTPAPRSQVVAAPPPPVTSPPEPGIDRAQWLGERIAAMTGRERAAYLPHTRRRIAAHRALATVAGYHAADAETDGLLLAGGLSLHLEGLNAYAARVFAGQED